MIPYVIERDGRRASLRHLFPPAKGPHHSFSQVDDEIANAIVAQMLFLQSDDPKADIHMYINSPEVRLVRGSQFYDTMQFISCDVATYCIGKPHRWVLFC